MSKPLTGKCVTFELEFFWRGKRRKPSVSFIFENEGYEGLPDKILESPEFSAFSKAAHDFCQILIDAGELD